MGTPGDHPLLVHGPGDVVGDEAGLLHGIDEVSRGLQHCVVGHEICGSHAVPLSRMLTAEL